MFSRMNSTSSITTTQQQFNPIGKENLAQKGVCIHKITKHSYIFPFSMFI
jgi:hypothetical protein